MFEERSITWLNETGDITLSWTKDRDEVMKEIIKRKMEEGYSFFIVNTSLRGTNYTKITSVDQIKKHKITMTDKEAEQLVGGASFSSLAQTNIETTGKATTPEQVVKNKTVATRPVRGG